MLLEVVLCATAITLAARRVRADLEPVRRSCDLLHRDVTQAVERVSRDSGRAAAGRQLLLRRGRAPTSR